MGLFPNLKSNELIFNLAVAISTVLNYFLLILINKSPDASDYYLVVAIATILISFISLGFPKSVLRYFSKSAIKRALFSAILSSAFTIFIISIFYDIKWALIPVIGIVDMILIYLRKKGVAFDFLLVKVSLPLAAIIIVLFFECNFLAAIYSSYAVAICVFLITFSGQKNIKLESNNVSFKVQARYSWPLSINEILRIAASYADQIVLGAVVSFADLTGYTLFIRLGIGMRTLFTIPQVRLLPLILKEQGQHQERFKDLGKKYFTYTLVVAILFYIFRDLLLETFNISVKDYSQYFCLLLFAEVFRSMSGFFRLKFSIGEKTTFNLLSNLVHTFVILILFFPMYDNLGILGLILAQFCGSVIQLLLDYYLIKKYV